MNERGSTVIYVMVLCAAAFGAYFFIFQRNDSLIKDINTTTLSYQQESKLFEIRSLLTLPKICEGSLKGFKVGTEAVFKLQTTPATPIDVNTPGEEVKIKQLRLLPLEPVTTEFADGRIEVEMETRKSNTAVEKTIRYIPFNFLVDMSDMSIKECLGEKTPESAELFRTTIAQKRAEICQDALKGTINSEGKCEWPW